MLSQCLETTIGDKTQFGDNVGFIKMFTASVKVNPQMLSGSLHLLHLLRKMKYLRCT